MTVKLSFIVRKYKYSAVLVFCSNGISVQVDGTLCRRQGPKSSQINPALQSLHWLKIKQRIDYKILSVTYKVLTTTQPS